MSISVEDMLCQIAQRILLGIHALRTLILALDDSIEGPLQLVFLLFCHGHLCPEAEMLREVFADCIECEAIAELAAQLAQVL